MVEFPSDTNAVDKGSRYSQVYVASFINGENNAPKSAECVLVDKK